MGLIDLLAMMYTRYMWKKKNKNNATTPENNFIRECVHVGNYTYGKLFAITSNSKVQLFIGNFVSIAPKVVFIVSGDHDMKNICTYPFKANILQTEQEEAYTRDMHIDDDVWIGTGAIILSGIHICQGAVIGAGAIVSKDVPPYAVVVGAPAKIIRYRFSDEIIEKMLEIDYSRLTKKEIEEHIEQLYEPVYDAEQIKWLPHK